MLNRISYLLAVTFVLLLPALSFGGPDSDDFMLVSEHEAAMPDASKDELQKMATRGYEPSEGPEIIIVSPAPGEAVEGKVSFDIQFKAKDGEGTEVKLASVKVEYIKYMDVDLTDRMKDHITQQGIDVKNAKLPEGTHWFRVSVCDVSGKTTKKEFAVGVKVSMITM